MVRIGPRIAAPIAVILLASGCVGVQRHRALQASYAELQAHHDQVTAENRDLAVLVNALHGALREAEARRDDPLARFYDDLLTAFRPQLEAERAAVMVYPDRLTLALADGVHFETGSAALTAEGDDAIGTLAEVLELHPERRFVVEGHTDSLPISTARYPSNWALGAARAVAVLDALDEAGISGARLSAASFADTEPLETNESVGGRATNRRVEISFQPTLDELPGYERLVEAAARVIRAEDAPPALPPERLSRTRPEGAKAVMVDRR
jgi:chemotaxis protein MotB